MNRLAAFSLLAAIGCCTLLGCSTSAPTFRPILEGRDPQSVRPDQATAMADSLQRLFGTPDTPAVPQGVPLRIDLLTMAAGPIGCDAQGNQWGLFRRHCAACHGLSGDGAGPSAAVLTPYPRDFRTGTFKYTSTKNGAKPIRDDLTRTLRHGIPGTAMPSFRKLPEREIDALIEYVEYLAIRGQTELYLLQTVVDDDGPLPLDHATVLDEGVLPAARSWSDAQLQNVEPSRPPFTDTPVQLAASIDRGRQLFHATAAQCVKCHGPLGDGNGELSGELYDDWNKPKKGETPEQTQARSRWFRLPIQRLRPRNFTLETFHGGDRPIDLYWRIYVGIKGTPMPPAGPAQGNAGVLTPEEIWDVIHYVQSLRK